MTRRSQWTTDRKVPKKALRKSGRKITFRGQAYVSMLRRRRMSRAARTTSFVDDVFGEDFHVKRVQSLASGVLGVLHASMLSIAVIGRAMADIACVYLVTRAGRALPLVCKTVKKSGLKDNQTRLETG